MSPTPFLRFLWRLQDKNIGEILLYSIVAIAAIVAIIVGCICLGYIMIDSVCIYPQRLGETTTALVNEKFGIWWIFNVVYLVFLIVYPIILIILTIFVCLLVVISVGQAIYLLYTAYRIIIFRIKRKYRIIKYKLSRRRIRRNHINTTKNSVCVGGERKIENVS